MTTRKISLFFLALTCVLLSVRCKYEPPLHATALDWLELKLEDVSLEAQIALTRKEKAEGLMYREKLAPNQGMLFVFEQPSKQRFWMKDTQIPLSVGFFNADGTLLEIHALYPQDRNPVASHSDAVVMALEMNQGWYQQNSIAPGSTLDRETLDRAFRLRGVDTKKFQWYQPIP